MNHVYAVKVYRSKTGSFLRVLLDGRVERYGLAKIWMLSDATAAGLARESHFFELVAKHVVFKCKT